LLDRRLAVYVGLLKRQSLFTLLLGSGQQSSSGMCVLAVGYLVAAQPARSYQRDCRLAVCWTPFTLLLASRQQLSHRHSHSRPTNADPHCQQVSQMSVCRESEGIAGT